MISSATRSAVWNDMLHARRLVRYYEEMSRRYRLYDSVIRWTLLISASGITAKFASTTLRPMLPEYVAAWDDSVFGVFGVFVVLAVLLDLFEEFGRKAEVLRTAGAQCSELASQWDKLWLDLNAPEADDADIRSRNAELDYRITLETDRADAKVRENRKVNLRCTEAADKEIRERFVTT